MKTMNYKGYTAEIHYSEEDGCFVGHLININAIAGFHGDTDEEVRAAFENMVDVYIELLEEEKAPPQEPDTDNFLARLRQAFHHKFMKQLPWKLK